MSEIKVNKISPRTNCGTVTLGDSGDTITIPAGATITNSGTASGFGATGSASWTTTVKTGDFTAVAGEGYFVDTSSGAVTVTLPSSPSAGNVVAISDYARNSATNNITIGRNSQPIGGVAQDHKITDDGLAVTLIYINSTKGWIVTDSGDQNDVVVPYNVNFLIVAGGGGGGISGGSGGGGAGGYRASFNCEASGGGGSSESAFTAIGGTTYTVTVGAGGAAHPYSGCQPGNDGNLSSIAGPNISTISSVGGGGGGGGAPCVGRPGGSGGGADDGAGGTGTTNQGFAGGTSNSGGSYGGGGGGAGAVGTNATSPTAGPGGNGVASTISGSPVTRGGGGGGATFNGTAGGGGTGGGGDGADDGGTGTAGTANTGGGGGGGALTSNGASVGTSGAGGSGVVILRWATADATIGATRTGLTDGGVQTDGSDSYIVFTAGTGSISFS